jgi:hypothetical protein
LLAARLSESDPLQKSADAQIEIDFVDAAEIVVATYRLTAAVAIYRRLWST